MEPRYFAFLLAFVVGVSSFAALVAGDEAVNPQMSVMVYDVGDLPIWSRPVDGKSTMDATVLIALIKSKALGVENIKEFKTNSALVIHGTQEAHEQVAEVLKSLRRPVASPVSAADSPRTERVVSSPIETATARDATVTMQKAGPKQLKVGQYGDFFLFVKNAGDTPLAGLQVIDEYSAEFRVVEVIPPASRYETRRVVWLLPQLAPGQTQVFQVKCKALSDVQEASSRGTVRGPDGLERADQVCLSILPETGESDLNVAESTASYLQPAPAEKAALDLQPGAPGRYQLIGESGWIYRIDTETGEVVGMPVGAQGWSRVVELGELTSQPMEPEKEKRPAMKARGWTQQ